VGGAPAPTTASVDLCPLTAVRPNGNSVQQLRNGRGSTNFWAGPRLDSSPVQRLCSLIATPHQLPALAAIRLGKLRNNPYVPSLSTRIVCLDGVVVSAESV